MSWDRIIYFSLVPDVYCPYEHPLCYEIVPSESERWVFEQIMWFEGCADRIWRHS